MERKGPVISDSEAALERARSGDTSSGRGRVKNKSPVSCTLCNRVVTAARSAGIAEWITVPVPVTAPVPVGMVPSVLNLELGW